MLPLEGVEVLSLAINVPGPVAAARLRDLGARVRKVEPPMGDYLAFSQPEWYRELHENIDVQRLDLKTPDARQQLDELLSATDVLISANRPSALVRLGLGPDDLEAKFPKLCHVAIVGYGAPYEEIPGHDLTYQAQLGLLAPPAMPRTLIADLAGAQEAVITALSMLRAREKTGKGGTQQVSLAEAAETFAIPAKYGLTTPDGPLGGTLPGYNIYAAAKGWVAVAALEPHFLEKLRLELDIAHPTREGLAGIFATRTAADWEEWAEPRGLPISALK